MPARTRLHHWLMIALLLASAAGGAVAAPTIQAGPEPGASEPAADDPAADPKSAKALRRAEEERAKAQRRAEEERKQAERRAEKELASERRGAPTVGAGSATSASGATVPPPPPTTAPDAPSDATTDEQPALDPIGSPAIAAEESLRPEDLATVPVDLETAPPPEQPPSLGPDAVTLLADSLVAYESAQGSWEQGQIDAAFAALDRAYELMAAVDTERDPLRTQEKEDLRRLISRRVVEIYASRPTAAGDLEGSIPFDLNEHVQREIASFSGPERQFFLDSYARGGQYLPMVLEELRAAGMPLELAWMPIVESGFKVRAYSVARALGLWQFIPSTGYRFGLERNNWIDERMDPHKSTKAAIAYLTELHGLFGDWLTALAAYNCGEHLVLRLLSSQPVSYFDHFWDLYLRLPRETRRYVPRFLAVRAILENPAAYGFDLPQPMAPVEYEVVRTERTVDLADLERRLQLPDGSITGLNPELRRNATPTEPYDVKVPRGTVERVAATIVEMPARVVTAEVAPGSSSTANTHRVRPGETLSRVAARYGTTVNALVALNGLSSADRIRPGQTLRVRGTTGSSRTTSAGVSVGGGSSPTTTSAAGAATTHRVRQGDNLWVIAQRYGTTVERIKRDNGLNGNLLHVGQKLVIKRG